METPLTASSPRPLLCVLGILLAAAVSALAQSIALPWSSHGHDPQHSGLSAVAGQALNRIVWQTPVDLAPQYYNNGTLLLAHYGSPLITRENTVIVPVKTGPYDNFRVEGRSAANGALLWTQPTDYTLPSHDWLPSYNVALTPKNRLYFPGAGGTVYFREAPDAASGATGQIAFYGLADYQADPATFNTNVKINTPITSDRYGNIYFGFQVTGATTPALQSGVARIAEDGTGIWKAASYVAADAGISKVVGNCAPSLSNDQTTLYIAVSAGNFSRGYLVALDGRTLEPVSKVALKDVRSPGNDALLPDNGSACPTVGPDGDVYFGVLESPFGSNRYRGWLLHFDQALAQTKTPGLFGWDDTVSIVPSALVTSYQGASAYLILTKYNNYVVGGGGGDNRIAILDPKDTMADPPPPAQSTATVMKEIFTALGPTTDSEYPNVSTAVREWCVNTVAVDPFTKSAIVHSEDGKIYRWDFASNSLIQPLTLTNGIGEAYTPSVIGVDGTVYVIATRSFSPLGNDAMRTLAAILISLGMIVVAEMADAAVTLTLTPAVQNSARGPELIFSGTLVNTSATDKVFLNGVQATFPSNDPVLRTLNANPFFSNVPGILLPGETYTGVLFSVLLSEAAPPGDYAGTMVVKGGADILASGDLASASFDGTKSLLEYALNLDPRVVNPGLPLQPAMTGGYLTISYVPNLAAAGLLYAVEASADLVHWSTANVEAVAVPNPIPSNRVTVRYAPPIPVTRAFLRLNVTQSGP